MHPAFNKSFLEVCKPTKVRSRHLQQTTLLFMNPTSASVGDSRPADDSQLLRTDHAKVYARITKTPGATRNDFQPLPA